MSESGANRSAPCDTPGGRSLPGRFWPGWAAAQARPRRRAGDRSGAPVPVVPTAGAAAAVRGRAAAGRRPTDSPLGFRPARSSRRPRFDRRCRSPAHPSRSRPGRWSGASFDYLLWRVKGRTAAAAGRRCEYAPVAGAVDPRVVVSSCPTTGSMATCNRDSGLRAACGSTSRTAPESKPSTRCSSRRSDVATYVG